MVRKKKELPVENPLPVESKADDDSSQKVIVAPSEKVKPKRTMTPEMLEKLAIARKKALEVKKRLKDNDEEKIKHIQVRMQKDKDKKDKKINLIKLAEEGLETKTKKTTPPPTPSPPPQPPVASEGLEIPKLVLSVDDKPKPEPPLQEVKEEELKPSGNVVDLSSQESLKKLLDEYNYNKNVNKATDRKLQKLNKKYVVDSDSSSDDEPQSRQQVVYIKRKQKDRPAPPRLGISYNDKTREAIPPSLIEARQLSNRYRI